MIQIFESFREHIFDDNTRLKWKLKIEEILHLIILKAAIVNYMYSSDLLIIINTFKSFAECVICNTLYS